MLRRLFCRGPVIELAGAIVDDGPQVGVATAGRDGEMPGRPAEIDQRLEPAEIECRHDLRGAEQALAVHAHQKLAFQFLGAEEVREDRAVPAVRLLPAVRALADRVFQMRPELPEDVVAIMQAKKDDGIFFFRRGSNGAFFKLKTVESRPLTGEDAETFARRALTIDLFKDENKKAQSAAESQASFEGDYVRIMGRQEPSKDNKSPTEPAK